MPELIGMPANEAVPADVVVLVPAGGLDEVPLSRRRSQMRRPEPTKA